MTWADIIMYAVILCIGVPASFRSPVALVLLAWWLAGMVVWMLVGSVPGLAAIALDVVAFLVVGRLIATWADAAVAMLFAPTIYAHALLTPYDDWLVSWAIGLVQFLTAAAGARQINSWRDALARSRDIRERAGAEFARLRGRVACWNG